MTKISTKGKLQLALIVVAILLISNIATGVMIVNLSSQLDDAKGALASSNSMEHNSIKIMLDEYGNEVIPVSHTETSVGGSLIAFLPLLEIWDTISQTTTSYVNEVVKEEFESASSTSQPLLDVSNDTEEEEVELNLIGVIDNDIPDDIILQPIVEETHPNQKYYDVVTLDKETIDEIVSICEDAGMAPEIVFAMAFTESSYTPDAKSNGNHGLLQINSTNFGWIGDRLGYSEQEVWDNVYDPIFNTRMSIEVFKEGMNCINIHTWNFQLMAYNKGVGGALDLYNQGVNSIYYDQHIVNYAVETFGFDVSTSLPTI